MLVGLNYSKALVVKGFYFYVNYIKVVNYYWNFLYCINCCFHVLLYTTFLSFVVSPLVDISIIFNESIHHQLTRPLQNFTVTYDGH